MSIGLLWKAAVAISAGAALGFLALAFFNGADEPASPAAAIDHFAPRVSLIRQATNGQLISLQIGPFEVGSNSFRVTLLNPIGQAQKLDSAHLRLSRLESSGIIAEVDAAGSGLSKDGRIVLPAAGWWQFNVVANGAAAAIFYIKLDQPSSAPTRFAPPDYPQDAEAQAAFEAAVSRYTELTGLTWREELTSGDPGPGGHGVWFITNINASSEGFHATTLNPEQGSSELYSDRSRQCFRQGRESWQCTDGPGPLGPFDLSYMRGATGFQMGRQEMVDGEMTQVVFFYNPSQSAWYAWWIGHQTQYIRRQAMVASGHFMLDRYTGHDTSVSIQPGDLPNQ